MTQNPLSKSPDLLLWFVCILAAGSVGLEASADDDIDGLITQIARKYSVSVSRVIPSSETGHYHIVSAKPATTGHVRTYLPILASEFNLYPPELVKRCGLWRIVLCEKMTCHSGQCAGLADGPGHTVYLDPDYDSANEVYLRQAIHHEFFHIIDYALFDYSDKTWLALDRPIFAYPSYGPAESNLSLAGFVSRYAMTNMREDRAEVFEFMMVSGRELDERAATDAVIHAKMQRMKQMLKELCPEIDEDFWQAARRVPRPSDSPKRSLAATPETPTRWTVPSGFVVASLVSIIASRRWRKHSKMARDTVG